MPLSTYLNLGLGELAHTNLTVELADRTMKYPKGIAENVLVGIGKFVFPIDFIILDMPKDVKVPLILGRQFLSTTHAKIDVFKRKITLRIVNEKIIFKSVKPASSLIKRVYMLSLRERMEVDLEARLMGETLLRRDQVDDLMPTIEEGEVIDEPMIDIIKTRNNESFDEEFYNYIIRDKVELKGKNVVEAFMNVPIFVGKFSIVTHFVVVENIDGYRDQDMGDIILGEPFCKASCVEAKRFLNTAYSSSWIRRIGPRCKEIDKVGEVSIIWNPLCVVVMLAKGGGGVVLPVEIPVSERYIAPCFVNGLEAYDGEKNLAFDENLISNEYAVKLCLDYEVKKENKVVKKELIVALKGELYFVKFIINPKEDDVEPGIIFRRSFMRLVNEIVDFGSGDQLLDFNFDDIPQLDGEELSPFVCKIGKSSRNKKRAMENLNLCYPYIGTSSSTGRHLTLIRGAKTEALALSFSQKVSLCRDVRPVLENGPFHDKSDVLWTAKSDRDDEEEYEIKRNKFGAPFMTMRGNDAEAGSSRSKCSRQYETVEELLHEFYSTYEFDEVCGDDELQIKKIIKFRLGERAHNLTLLECAHRLGLYHVDELEEDGFDVYFQGGLCSDDHFNAQEYWLSISREESLGLSRSHASSIRNPILWVIHKMITYGLCQRTTGYDKIQKNDLWLLSMFDARHQYGYANVAWLIARWMKRKGAGTQKESQIRCGQFIKKIARKARVLNDVVIRSLSALIYCRDLDMTILRELIDSEGRLIPEDSQPGVPRVGIPRPPRASKKDLYKRMGNIEIRQGRLRGCPIDSRIIGTSMLEYLSTW
ncbi:retrotransposon ORF1 [Tanacetum coccineum]